MATVQINNVKAADPGLGFTLLIDDNGNPINQTLKIVAKVTDPQGNSFSTTVQINDPVQDLSLNFVVPFGDNEYKAGEFLDYHLEIIIPHDLETKEPISEKGQVVADSGKFLFESNMITSVPSGDMLGPGDLMNSSRFNHVGIMQLDGDFCVYQQFARNGKIKKTDSSNSSGSGDNCSLMVRDGRIFIHNNTDHKDVSASPKDQAISGASMVIFNGEICLLGPQKGSKPKRVKVSPQNL